MLGHEFVNHKNMKKAGNGRGFITLPWCMFARHPRIPESTNHQTNNRSAHGYNFFSLCYEKNGLCGDEESDRKGGLYIVE